MTTQSSIWQGKNRNKQPVNETGCFYGRMAELVDAADLDSAGHLRCEPREKDPWGFETLYAHRI